MEGADGLPRTAYVLNQPGADIDSDHDSENGERGSENECDTTRGPLDSPPPTKRYFKQFKGSARFRGGERTRNQGAHGHTRRLASGNVQVHRGLGEGPVGTLKIGVLGTGAVGRAVGGKLMQLGHDVVFGTRDVAKTLADTKPDYMGNPPFSAWIKTNPKAKLVPFAAAAAHGEVLVNATAGAASLKALSAAGERNLVGKILIDISNALDFSKGMPPSLIVCNTDSLGEQIQRAFPKAKVVKTLNTMTNMVMVNPDLVAKGDHDVFVSGNDAGAKAKVTEILRSFGWKRVIDLGDITTARGAEMVLPIWVQLMGAMKTPMFNFKIAQ